MIGGIGINRLYAGVHPRFSVLFFTVRGVKTSVVHCFEILYLRTVSVYDLLQFFGCGVICRNDLRHIDNGHSDFFL